MNKVSRSLLTRLDRHLPRRLTTRMTLAVVIIVITAGLVTTAIINHVLVRDLRAQSVASGQALTQALSESLANALVEGDLAAIQEAVNGTVQREDDIVYAFAFGPNTPIVHSFPNGFPAALMETMPLPPDQPERSLLLDTDLGLIRDFGDRPLDGLPAEVHVGISQQGIVAAQRQVTSFILALTAIGCLFAAAAAHAFGKVATHPLQELTDRVHHLGRGHLDQRIDLPPGDEVGDLAAAFNQMAGEIQDVIERLRASEAGYGDLLKASGTVGEGIALICDEGPNEGTFLYVNETFARLAGYEPADLLGMNAAAVLHPASLEAAHSSWIAIRDGVAVGAPPDEFTLVDRQGRERVLETAGTMIEYQGQRALAWFTRDVTDRKEREEKLRKRNRELAALNAVASAMSTPSPASEMLQRTLDSALDALELQIGWILTIDDDDHTSVAASRGVDLDPNDFVFPSCQCGVVLSDGTSVIVDPVDQDCALRRLFADEDLPQRCHVTVPVQARGRVLGILTVVTSATRSVEEDDLALLDAIGQQIGVALENAYLWEELQQREQVRGELLARVIRAQEDERQRIARELHDGVGQSLNALVFGLNTVSTSLTRTPEATPDLIDRLRTSASETVKELQDVIYDLRPSLLDDLGLCRALRWYTQERLAGYGVGAVLDVPDDLRLPTEVETALFRIAQEAITNVVRHADARTIHIALRDGASRVAMEISDDGIGFDPKNIMGTNGGRRGWGLLGMQERVSLLNGTFTLDSAPDRGTRLNIELPVEIA